MPHDHDGCHTSAATTTLTETDRASRKHLSTGELLTTLGQRIGQPARQSNAPRRRPLLTTQAAAAAVQAPQPDPEAPPPAVLTLLDDLAAWDVAAAARARAVARYAVAIATTLAPALDVPRIRHAALLCNIGMTAVPHAILAKTTPLTDAERALIRRHPIHSAEILQASTSLREEVVLVLHHHEDYDGSGYPYSLSGDWIPLGARIIRVAETYDALLQERPYRAALTPAEAIATLHAKAAHYFDPHCLAALATYLAQHPRASNNQAKHGPIIAGGTPCTLPYLCDVREDSELPQTCRR